MFIEYCGHSCFFLKGKSFSVVTDPFKGIGLSLKRFSCDYVLVSHEHFDHDNVSGVDYKKAIYSTEGIFTGIPCYHDEVHGAKRGQNTAFYFEMDGLKVMHLGDLGEPFDIITAQKFKLPVDVLFIPIGGKYTIDDRDAEKYIEYIGAKHSVIMHYKTEGNTVDIAYPDEFMSRCKQCAVMENGVEITSENLGTLPSIIKINF